MPIQTSLPDLPFTGYGDVLLKIGGTRSSATANPRSPRTDLKTLTPWTSFPNDIHAAIQSATANAHLPTPFGPFPIEVSTMDTFVKNEEEIRAHAMYTLHNGVEQVLTMLGVTGAFETSGGGNSAVVGAPDFSWFTGPEEPHPKVSPEYKTWWVADLETIVDTFNGTRHDTIGRHSLDALQQTYGYMTFNNHRFGILSNWKHALFLRRAETSGQKTLEYHLVKLGPEQPISMLKAWVGMVLLAENDWFYASPTTSIPPDQNFGNSTAAWKERKKALKNAQDYQLEPVDGKYKCIDLDFCLCRFNLSTTRGGEMGCVVDAQFLAPATGKCNRHVICKVVDVLRHPIAATSLNNEASAYANLHDLQGKVVPTLYGFYKVWGILQLLALEPVGDAIPDGEEIDNALCMKMKAALQRIHDAGYIHGDIARRNFCRKGPDVFLVDLENCRRSQDPDELEGEMSAVDGL